MIRGRASAAISLTLIAAISLTSCRRAPSNAVIVLATPTSIANSGLLPILVDQFHQEQGITVRSHLVGSGLALDMLERGEADVALKRAWTTVKRNCFGSGSAMVVASR